MRTAQEADDPQRRAESCDYLIALGKSAHMPVAATMEAFTESGINAIARTTHFGEAWRLRRAEMDG